MNQPSPQVAQQSESIDSMLLEAVHLHVGGEIDRAVTLYRAILAEVPEHFDARHMLGALELQRGRLQEAQTLISAALEINPNDAVALNNLATAYMWDNKPERAVAAAERANQLSPHSRDILANLGAALHQLWRFREAIAPLREAYELDPGYALVCGWLGACLLKTGAGREAVEVYLSATTANPDHAEAWANYSVALHSVGQFQQAVEAAERAIELNPRAANAFSALAAARFELGALDEAIEACRQAVQLSPVPTTLCAFANALITSGLHSDALQYIHQAIEIDADHPVARWLLAVTQILPMCDSEAQITQSRLAFANALSALDAWFQSKKPLEAFRAAAVTQPFYLAYQPFNNRELLSLYGKICVQWMSTLPLERALPRSAATRNRKIRLGIASTHIRNHSVWVAITKGWLENFNKKHFEISLFQLTTETDTETLRARKHAAHFEDQPTDVQGWAEAISKADLDFLLHPAIGMDPVTTQLAALRLAPLQAATWGHPETSGLSSVDFYLSGAALEPPGAQQNYSERLIELPNFSVYVEPLNPKIVDPNLKGLRLPTDEPLLLCPGSPFKYSPIHDRVWIQIAKGLAASKRGGRLVFFAGNRGAMYKTLETRLRNAFSEAGVAFDAHVQVIPQLERPRFFGLMQRSALMLDTLGFSGFNTGLQAVEAGLPILTFEGDFMRGRLASCFMRKMEIPDLVASTPEKFVERAVELAQDPDKRKRLGKDIAKRRKVLFADLSPVRALEDFIAQAVREL